MSKEDPLPHPENDSDYAEFARRMELFEHGPFTTNFQRLQDIGIERLLPQPCGEHGGEALA